MTSGGVAGHDCSTGRDDGRGSAPPLSDDDWSAEMLDDLAAFANRYRLSVA